MAVLDEFQMNRRNLARVHRVPHGVRSHAGIVVVAAGLVLSACGPTNAPAPVEADGTTITLPEPARGPVPDLDVDPASATASPLPELAVRRLNGDGGWVQLKNELPADRPLLVWFWAPH